jgi:(2Fe-2S) ferredoxin
LISPFPDYSTMSKQSNGQNKTTFWLRGQFIGFAAPGAKLMRLATPTGEFTVKLDKALRPSLNRTLRSGDWLEVSGYQKFDPDSHQLKLKAEQVLVQSPQPAAALEAQTTLALLQSSGSAQASPRRKPEILVCQKSDCCKLGGNTLMRELQAELDERGLNDVKLRGTGCMKRCKAGPNLIMPDKSRYSRVKASDAAALLDQHFPGSSEIAS